MDGGNGSAPGSMPEIGGLDSAWQAWEESTIDPRIRDVFFPHCRRVMVLAYHLAREVGVEPEPVAVAGLLHDIGKVGIDAGILFKPSELSDMEWAIVQGHSHVGNWICRQILDRPRAARFVRDHHERWDGEGYPRGLEGEEISLGGRVLAVADVYDTLVGDFRLYDPAEWSPEQALQELERCAGTQFAPAAVRTLFRVLRDEPNLRSGETLIERADALGAEIA